MSEHREAAAPGPRGQAGRESTRALVSRTLLANVERSGWCMLSRAEIAALCQRNPKTVGRIIGDAVGDGLIARAGQGTAVIYKPLFTEPLEKVQCVPSKWPPEKIARLRELRDTGESFSGCADAMGVSRSAIAGKMRRLKRAS